MHFSQDSVHVYLSQEKLFSTERKFAEKKVCQEYWSSMSTTFITWQCLSAWDQVSGFFRLVAFRQRSAMLRNPLGQLNSKHNVILLSTSYKIWCSFYFVSFFLLGSLHLYILRILVKSVLAGIQVDLTPRSSRSDPYILNRTKKYLKKPCKITTKKLHLALIPFLIL